MNGRTLPCLAASLVLVSVSAGQSPSLVLDIEPGPGSSYPAGLTNVLGTTYFAATVPLLGRELWRTDGTPGGTRLVKDIHFNLWDSSPGNLTAFRGLLFFAATDGVNGYEMWRTDGTDAGTVLFDLNPGPGSSNFEPLAIFDDRLWFGADDRVHGKELWATDGTLAGTQMVADLNPGFFDATPRSGHVFNGELYFSAIFPGANVELWKTDGTTAGTRLVKDINPGPVPSFPSNFATFNGELYFTADNNTTTLATNNELWKTDGTASGTVQVVDINGLPLAGSRVDHLRVFANRLFFVADDLVAGQELWVTDGSPAGTQLFLDIQPGRASSNVREMFVVDAGLAFLSDRGWWLTDGTVAGTRGMLCCGSARGPTPLGSRRVVLRGDQQLWFADGSLSPARVRLGSGGGTGPDGLSGGQLLFAASLDASIGSELYVADPGATAQPVGYGCGQDRIAPSLDTTDPVLGTTMSFRGTARANTTAVVLLGVPATAPLPRVLGCDLYVQAPLVALAPVGVAGSTWSTDLSLVNAPSLVGLRLAAQVAVFPSSRGLDWSNGVHLTTGF